MNYNEMAKVLLSIEASSYDLVNLDELLTEIATELMNLHEKGLTPGFHANQSTSETNVIYWIEDWVGEYYDQYTEDEWLAVLNSIDDNLVDECSEQVDDCLEYGSREVIQDFLGDIFKTHFAMYGLKTPDDVDAEEYADDDEIYGDDDDEHNG